MGIRDKDTEAGSTSTPDITGHTYVVRVGDTLSKIAEKMLGNSGAARDLFNANRDQVGDPNVLRPGQVLKIPTLARR
jgi:nucleoid-associated protein YgaU